MFSFLHKISVAQQSVGQKEMASFMEVLQPATAVLQTALKTQDLRAGWLCCIFILPGLQEFLWKLCNI